MMYEIEPHRTDQLVQSRAIDFVNKWYLEPVEDHTETIKKWKGIWRINEKFEEEIMQESKGYHLDLKMV